jgi:hypothetical protein
MTLELLRFSLPWWWKRPHALRAGRSAEWSKRQWTRAFKAAAFFSDDPSVCRPTEPLTLYRGASPCDARGLSWTVDRALARDYARGVLSWNREYHERHGVPAHVYRAVVQPNHVLAMFNRFAWPGASEVVVNPYGRWQLVIIEDVYRWRTVATC